MTDPAPEPSEPSESLEQSRGRELPSARDRSRGGERGGRGRTGRARRGGRGESGGTEGRPKPTPARSLAEAEAPTDAEPPTPAVEAELDGEAWTARVLGRSGGVRGLAVAPLMLVGFWRGPAADAAGAPDRELLTADRDLAALSPRELYDALLAASRPRASDHPRPFFSDPGDKRRR